MELYAAIRRNARAGMSGREIVQLHERGNGFEELLDPAGFSGLLSRAIVDDIHRQSRALDRNEYHNGYPDLVPHGLYPGNSVQHGTKGGLERVDHGHA